MQQVSGAFSLPKPQVVSLTEDRPCDECGAELVEGNRGRWYGARFFGLDCHHDPKMYLSKGRNRTGRAFRTKDYGLKRPSKGRKRAKNK